MNETTVAAFDLHYDKLGKIFGAGKFRNEEHFQSHLFNKNELNDQSVKKAFDNFITQSTNVLTDEEEKEIMNTFTSLSSTKLDTYGASNRLFLSKYTNPNINLHQRMYKLTLTINKNSCCLLLFFNVQDFLLFAIIFC